MRANDAEEGLASQASGPAFPMAVKALATALMGGLAAWGLRASGEILSAGLPVGSLVFLIATLAVVVLCYGAMMVSRTSVDTSGIRQSWLWSKQVAFADITQVKLVRVPGLDWLVTPRLVVRVGSRGLYTFPTADSRVQQVFMRMAGSSRQAREETSDS